METSDFATPDTGPSGITDKSSKNGNVMQLDIFAPDTTAESAPTNFRLLGDRRLAPTWRQRAADNLAAIRLLKQIESEDRSATAAEQARLIRFVGFGATDLSKLLGNGGLPPGFEPIAKALGGLVTPQERASLARATQYAHYTPENIVRAMWKGLRQLGFTGGAVLEAGAGTGLFNALMPEGIAMRSSFLGVERDPITARIAKLLYPESDIWEADFIKAILPPDFDLAIGNPPFANTVIKSADEVGRLGVTLHNYFIARSIERLRAGGLGAFVVSRYFMDAGDITAREYIASQADLLAAVRLPEAAMRADAGTDVVVDLTFFRKREAGEAGNGVEWVRSGNHGVTDHEGKLHGLNDYWASHPGMVLGQHAITSSQFGPAYTCKSGGGPLDILLSGAIGNLPSKVYAPARAPQASRREKPKGPVVQVGTAADGARIKEGSYFVRDGVLYQINAGQAERIKIKFGVGGGIDDMPITAVQSRRLRDRQSARVVARAAGASQGIFPKHAAIIRMLIEVRDAVRDVLRAQEADQAWDEAQHRLNAAYDAFVAKYGAINTTVISERQDPNTGEIREYYRYPNLAPFRDDPDSALVASIEHYDAQSNSSSKGPIFTQRVISPPPSVTVTGASDALAVVLNERGRVDMARIAEFLEKTEAEVAVALGDTVFLDPESGDWEMADAYLSGLVRGKLAAARKAAVANPRFDRNVAALELVQPIDLLPSEISARLGASWLPTDVVAQFSAEVIGIKAGIFHTPEVGSWSVTMSAFIGKAAATADWGTPRRHAGQLLLDALTSTIPQIWDVIEDAYGKETRVLNVKETQAAKDKLEAMKEAFVNWVWKDPERSDRLAEIYNRVYNNLVPRQFNGDHLLLPGASDAVTLRPHQKRAAWRMVAAGSTYLAQCVGSGKTMTLAAGIMEQRRLGLISKPVVVVPGHTLQQWSREFLMLYPTANILVADEENFSKEKRARFVARAATGNWDAVIITHSAFKFISVPRKFEIGMIEDQLQAYGELLDHVSSDDRTSIKRIEQLKEKLQLRLDGLRARKDDMLTIAEMGVDQICVDEAQQFRKLSFATNMSNLKGVDADGSQRAWDLYVKSKFLSQKKPGRSINLASGTPITNTMGEMFSLMRFMKEDALKSRDIHHFDAWSSTFCDTKTELELQASGHYKAVTRLSQFTNIPELIAMFRDVADVVLSGDLGEYVQLPEIRGDGKREILTYRGSPMFREYQKLLAARIEAIEQRGGKPEKGDDIILTVIGDGRHAAIDMRMVNPSKDLTIKGVDADDLDLDLLGAARDNDPGNKLNGLIDNVVRIWRETSENRYRNPATGDFYPIPGAAQMIFSDLGTLAVADTRGFSAYGWMIRRLVAAGIPREQIAIMQEFKKASAKQRLFNAVNSGLVRVLIGSSETMGTGVNAQQRLVHLHHLDAPWLPSLIEQREGRIRRQGNQNREIGISAYCTLGSMDATMWQLLERKMRFIDAVMSGDRSIRTLEDLDESQADQFAMAKALASGDGRLMQKAGLETEIARLQRQRDAHFDALSSVRREIRYAGERIERSKQRLSHIEADLLVRAIPAPEAFSMVVEGQDFTDRKEAGKALMQALSNAELEMREGEWVVAEYAGFSLRADGWKHGKDRYGLTVSVRRSGAYNRVYEQDLRSGDFVISRVESALNRIDQERAEMLGDIAKAEATISDYKKRDHDTPFPYQAVLDDKMEEWQRIVESLSPKVEVEEIEKVAA
jgi:N12 class adenine-specific DNA methylase/predicted RNA methylase